MAKKLKENIPAASGPNIPATQGKQVLTPELKVFLMQNNISPEEYFHVLNQHRKTGKSIQPQDVVKSVKSLKMAPTILQMKQFQQNYKDPNAQDVVPPPEHLMKREGKRKMNKVNLTESQLKETIKKAIVIHEKKKLVKKIVKEQLQEQCTVSGRIDFLLTEGPLSGVFSGIKQGAGALAQGAKQAFQGAGQAFMQGQAEEQARKQAQQAQQAAQKQLQTAMQSVAKAKQRYNKEILKNAETLNSYHDTALNLYQTYNSVANQLGPAAEQLGQDVKMTLGQLHYDLSSEKSQIDSFIQQLQKSTPELQIGGTGGYGAAAKAQTQKQRDEEAAQSGGSMQYRAKMHPSNVDYGKSTKKESKKATKKSKKTKKQK